MINLTTYEIDIHIKVRAKILVDKEELNKYVYQQLYKSISDRYISIINHSETIKEVDY